MLQAKVNPANLPANEINSKEADVKAIKFGSVVLATVVAALGINFISSQLSQQNVSTVGMGYLVEILYRFF